MGSDGLISRWDPFIREASLRFGIPAPWIRAVLIVESGGRTMLGEGVPITSAPGAMGLMQVMPTSWQAMQGAYTLGSDPYDPHDNILAGAAVLRALYAQYGYPGLFAAYNDGPGMLEARRQAGQMLPDETIAYVLDVARILRTGHRSARESLVGPKVVDRLSATDNAIDNESPRPIEYDDEQDSGEN